MLNVNIGIGTDIFIIGGGVEIRAENYSEDTKK